MRICSQFAVMAALLVGSHAAGDAAPARVPSYLQEIAHQYGEAEGLPDADTRMVTLDADGNPTVWTGHGAAALEDGRWTPVADATPPWWRDLADDTLGELRQGAEGPGGERAVAAENGLFRVTDDGYARVVVDDGQGRVWAASDVRGVAYDAAGRLWFATPAGVGVETSEGWRLYTGHEGLPYNDFTCAAAGGDGAVWFGTRRGAIRYDGEEWQYRQGRRWLPHDEVRAIAVDAAGNAWFATPAGVGQIERREMTLAEKAAHYEDEMDLIRRTPFGYTSEVRLVRPGDKSEIRRHDSDNDGLWTSMYGASQAYGYAATGDPARKESATHAFEALKFLQDVTQMGPHKPPVGYVARTILPGDGPDPMDGRVERDKRHLAERDSLWKVYETRWVLTDDGDWFWKGDTSSDELDGHYYFYPLYYDLVAETEEEKEAVRGVVRKLTDHLIDHGYLMMDNDGTPTRWGVYAPEKLNHDPNWLVERGLKSLSMLSYLAVAEHVTGDAKYREHFEYLRREHAFDTNAMVSKIQFGMGSGNQSDDEMAIMCYYNLLKYSNDEALNHEIRYAFYKYWMLMEPEMNPFFNFAFAAHNLGAEYTNPWGTWEIGPWDGWLDDAVATLTGFPMDRVNWAHENTHRLDIIRLPRQQSSEPYLPHRTDRGHRVNGKVVPVQERHFNHWNHDMWRLDTGGDGRGLASGAVFLLPYYMGLHYGFIEE